MLTLSEPDPGLLQRFLAAPATRDPEDPLLSRWARALAAGAQPHASGIERLRDDALVSRRQRATRVLDRSEQVLTSAAAELRRRGFALVLADDEGIILSSHSAEVLDPAVRSGLAAGSRWDEATRGTNAIGTALAEGTAVAVVGRAHFDPRAHGLVCYGAPIRDPSSGAIVGVLDLSGPVGQADPLIALLAESLASTIELALHARNESEARVVTLPRTPEPPRSVFTSILGDDPLLTGALARAAQFASSPLPVLLLAETGTGKELMARAIHEASGRGRGPFVAVNCGAMPESLLESTLFGYAPGAFTGARSTGSEGKIAAAHGGTLFLDEIAEMTPTLQAMLLRVLEDGTYSRIGENRERRAELRLISATCRDLVGLVREGRFRQDLFYRIQGVELTLPAVRQRADVPLLARQLLERETAPAPAPRLADSALAALAAHPWPGNVRELKMALRYALVASRGADAIEAHHLPPAHDFSVPAADAPLDRRGAEAAALTRALRSANGNLTAAARVLGVSRSTLYRMLERHGVSRFETTVAAKRPAPRR